ncbi:hypothetical protein LTR37_007279 [Vermiconidia calcicola]|uniref:Uncharacterized protein n=1 Tax=Vermiconidia calcicola TaxID=1690605 RepID=A0ACC3NE24_9PEZI|nr:hypothetical protein LTR37_007279 [Vermiconidia calcicola]
METSDSDDDPFRQPAASDNPDTSTIDDTDRRRQYLEEAFRHWCRIARSHDPNSNLRPGFGVVHSVYGDLEEDEPEAGRGRLYRSSQLQVTVILMLSPHRRHPTVSLVVGLQYRDFLSVGEESAVAEEKDKLRAVRPMPSNFPC